MTNTLAFQLYSLKEFEGGWEAAFQAVKEMGIDTIEVWSGAVPNDPGAPTSLDDIRAALSAAQMRLTCGHIALGEYDSRYEDWVQLLKDFGSGHWVIPFAQGESLEEWLGWLPKFRDMSARLKEDGLSLGYHNHAAELDKLGEKHVMEHLLDNLPELEVQFHIGQFRAERGIALPDWIRKYQGRICSLHVNDSTTDGAARLGEGTCRAEESIRAAVDVGVDTYIMEVRLVQDTLDGVKRDVDFTRALIG